MKKLTVLFLILALALSLASCSGDAEIPKGMQIASDEGVAYTLFVPSSWILTESSGIYGAYYSSSDRSSVNVSSFYPESDMASIDDYWSTCKASYAETYKNFSVISEAEQTLWGEKAALKYVFSADIDTVSYKFMQIIAVHNNMFYTFTYTSTPENYDSHYEDVDKMITEFIFK
ncbi:MAG: hypothetical protein E7671_01075 [Ruminococcaceae bacterium]|nr:hypothetical protein [Oscillospiraceae bacterium]